MRSTGKIFELKGLIRKIFPAKDLASRIRKHHVVKDQNCTFSVIRGESEVKEKVGMVEGDSRFGNGAEVRGRVATADSSIVLAAYAVAGDSG